MPYNEIDYKESNIKYINKDFSDIKASLIDYAKSYFPDTYRDFNETSPGMMLIEMSAYVGDVLNFYIDQQYREMMLPLAEERRNILNMAKMFGYKVKPILPAFVDLTFTQDVLAETDDPSKVKYASAGTFNKGIKVRSATSPSIIFETLDILDFRVTGSADTSVVSQANSDSGLAEKYELSRTVRAVSGETKTTSFTIGAPEKFLRLTLPETNVIDIISVKDVNENKWYRVDYLAQDKVPIETHYLTDELRDSAYVSLIEGTTEVSEISVPYSLEYIRTEKRFITETNNDNTTSLIFGNGILKGNTIQHNYLQLEQAGVVIPGQTTDIMDVLDPLLGDEYSTLGEIPNNTTLTVTYRIGGGINANVPVGDLTTKTSTSNAIDGTTGTIKGVTNLIPARGGMNQQSIDEIRQKTSAFFTTQNRAVTKEDYEARILNMPAKYGGIAKTYVSRAGAGLIDEVNAFADEALFADVQEAIQEIEQIRDVFIDLYTDIWNQVITEDEFTIGWGWTQFQSWAQNLDHVITTNLTPLLTGQYTYTLPEGESRFPTITIYILGYDNNKNLVGNPHAADLGTNDGVTLLMEQNIKNYLNQYKILTDLITIQDGYIINFGVEFDVAAHKYANQQEVKLKCINKIKDYFHIDKMQFNQPINKGQLMYELLGIEGVRGINEINIVQQWSADDKLFSYTYDGVNGYTSEGLPSGYGYFYDFEVANVNDVIIPSNPMGTPSVFELKNPNNNIKGEVR